MDTNKHELKPALAATVALSATSPIGGYFGQRKGLFASAEFVFIRVHSWFN